MKIEEFKKRYGEEAWQKKLAQRQAYYKEHKEETKVAVKKYHDAHPEQLKATRNELNRKGGKHYNKALEDNRTGLRGERNAIRHKHGRQYRPYKAIIAPESQIHHEWIPQTDEYRGIALVEADAHQYGIVDVIEILAGKITLRTEEEVRKGKKKNE